MIMDLKLGKLPAKIDSRTIRLGDILKPKLPDIPASFDMDVSVNGVPDDRMFLNDQLGDCVIAGRAHMTMRFEKFEQNLLINISDDEVRTEYFKETGGPDSGLVMLDSLKAWRNNGWLAAQRLYNVYAYASVDWKNHLQVMQCIYFLEGMYIGFYVPYSAINDFNAGKTIWDVQANDGGIAGGHAIYIVAYDEVGPTCYTWGKRIKMTWAFWDKYLEEAYAVVDARDAWVDPNSNPLDSAKLDQILDEITGGTSMSVTFVGQVSSQSRGGERVDVQITRPDGSVDGVNGITDMNGSFAIDYDAPIGSGYKAYATIASDSSYKAATSDTITFDITKLTRTISLTVR